MKIASVSKTGKVTLKKKDKTVIIARVADIFQSRQNGVICLIQKTINWVIRRISENYNAKEIGEKRAVKLKLPVIGGRNLNYIKF